jgi:cytochrome b561
MEQPIKKELMMKRYHPLLVSLHWLLAILILFSLLTGSNILAELGNDDPEKIAILKVHMIVGLVIFSLMLLRLIVRIKTKKPKEIDTGNTIINKAGKYTHYIFYVLVFLIVASGLGVAILTGLPDIVFFESGAVLPETFNDLLPRKAHGFLTKALFFLIVLHLLAVLYHQFVRKDGLLSRMWFGKQKEL